MKPTPEAAFGRLTLKGATPADRHNKPRSGAVAAKAHVREADVKTAEAKAGSAVSA